MNLVILGLLLINYINYNIKYFLIHNNTLNYFKLIFISKYIYFLLYKIINIIILS
jgi:hypothetical protein